MESMKAKNQTNSVWKSMTHQSMNDWMIIEGIKKKKYVLCDIGYCKVGEKGGVMIIPVRWQWEVLIDMDWNDWMWICQMEHPLVILKDVVSVILVLVTLVSRSK